MHLAIPHQPLYCLVLIYPNTLPKSFKTDMICLLYGMTQVRHRHQEQSLRLSQEHFVNLLQVSELLNTLDLQNKVVKSSLNKWQCYFRCCFTCRQQMPGRQLKTCQDVTFFVADISLPLFLEEVSPGGKEDDKC